MRSGLKDYVCEFSDKLNYDLMDKSYDKPLVDYIVDVWKSLEVVLPQIHFDYYEYSEKESDININKLLFNRFKKKKKKDRYEIKNVLPDRVGTLTVHMTVKMIEKDTATGEITQQNYPIKKEMLIPLQDENGYYMLKGKKFYLIYQMVEKSTYTSQSSVTLKSLMPVAVKRVPKQATDILGNEYTLPSYNVFVVRKEIPILLFYMARGLNAALDFLNLYDVITPIDTLPEDAYDTDEYLYFPLNNKNTCYIQVVKKLFDDYTYVKAIVGSLYDLCMTGKNGKAPLIITLSKLEDEKVWIKKMNSQGSYDRSISIMQYFNRLMDETTKKILKVPAVQKYDIYALLRWMQEEFQYLRMKDNCDLSNKRLRCNEYIAALLTLEFSKRLKRIISMGDKATIDNIREIFKFPGDILIQNMHTSGVLRFNDSVNDLDMFSRFKYTSKGPHSMGGSNSNNIGIRYRDIHPSHLGRLDMLVCGNSDPGTSGLISPFCKMESLYFNDDVEESSVDYEITKALLDRYKELGHPYLTFDFSNQDEYYAGYEALFKFNQGINVYGEKSGDHIKVVINDEIDIDDTSAPQTKALQKKKKKKPEDEVSEDAKESEGEES